MARRASRKPFTPPPPSKDQLTTVSPEALQRVLQQAMREVPGTGTAPREWPIYAQGSGWTWEEVQGALNQLANGSLRYAETLLLGMQKFPPFLHGQQTRTQTLVSTPLRLEAPEGLPVEPYRELVAHLPELWGGDSATAHGLAATGKYRVALGVAPASVTWHLSPSGTSFLPQIHAQQAGWLTFFPVENRYKFQAREGLIDVIPDGREWLLFRQMSAQYPHTEGLVRALGPVWWYAEAVIRLWWTYAKTHGSGQRKVKVPAQMRQQEDFKDLLTIARDMVGGSVVPCPVYADGASFDFELVEAKHSTYETFPAFLDYVVQWMTQLWLGATDNTGGGKDGSRARAQVHERVSLRYLAADCEVTAGALRILLRQWCRYNRIDPRLAPVPVFAWEPPADEQAEALVRKTNAEGLDKIMMAAERLEAHGVAVDWPELAERYKVPIKRGETPTPVLTSGGEASESTQGAAEVTEGAA